jgi:hypothetical protein
MIAAPQVYRASLSPFRSTSSGIYSVVGDLAPKGFLPHQFCLLGTPQAIANVASSINPSSPIHSQVSYLVSNLQGVHAPDATVPLVASAGSISDVLLKDKSWLSSSAVKPLHWHLKNGDVVLAVNGLDHDQYVDASRLLLRHGDGNVLTFIFRWPSHANP